MKSVLSIGLILLIPFSLFGQEGLIERKFNLEKELFKAWKIMSMTESVYSRTVPYKFDSSDCSKSNAKVTKTYQIDEQGNLIVIFDFDRTDVKVVSYKRNEKGECISKEYEYTDRNGNVKFHDTWTFAYNTRGQIEKEELKRGEVTLRTNVNAYDEFGQKVEQTSVEHGSSKWEFEYDKNGNLIKLKECRKEQADSFRCISVTDYTYKGRFLVKETKRSATTLEIWNDLEYKYDARNNLTEIQEISTSWESINNGPTNSIYTKRKTIQSFASDGRILTASEFLKDEPKPFRCTFYDYVVWKN
jgi:hypothetical protein